MSEKTLDLSGSRILLVDDQPANLDVLCELLEAEGYRISMAPNGEVALKIATGAETIPDLVLLDVMMPGIDGYEVCRQLKQDERTREIPVVFITAKDMTEGVLEGFRAGGVDYVTKPFRDEEVLVRVQTHLRNNRLSRELAERNEELVEKNRALGEEMAQRRALRGQLSMISKREAESWGLEGFVGRSPTIQRIFEDIHLMQDNPGTSVLIAGESGTGKELIARSIHFGGARGEGSFVPVNCAAVPAELVESMLFGHVRGAFTGADSDRAGYFEMAHEGTLFLDEIGDMPLELQGKLLRVLEDGEVWRIGAKEGRTVDVRVLAATNVDVQKRIQEGSFRQDLYFRLARFTVTAPSLRERREDIPLLAEHFVRLFCVEMGREVSELSSEVLEKLTGYDFPGNVRELKNVIERALIESGGEGIRPHHLHFLPGRGGGVSTDPPESDADAQVPDIPLNLDDAERWLIRRGIAMADGNLSKAARLLGTNRNRIYRALAQDEHGAV